MSTTEIVRVSHSPEETRALGRALAERLAPGDLICLFGELGAGKTTFMQGLVKGLDSPEPATSPSFTLIHEHQGRLRLFHLDLYRLGPDDLADAGIEDVIGSDSAVVIEWAERLPHGLRAGALEIHIGFDDSNPGTRILHFRPLGPRSTELASELSEHEHAHPRH